MSVVSTSFQSSLGPAESTQAHRLHFTGNFDNMVWDSVYQDIGAGWFRNRFYRLFGADLEPYDAILEMWQFALPKGKQYRVIGRNAHGALLLIEDMQLKGTAAPIRSLNPVLPAFWGDDHCVFMNYVGHWLPHCKIPGFSDSSLYDQFLSVSPTRLEPDEILAAKTPLSLGGTMTAENFQVENIFEYYRTTAAIYTPLFKE
jgi:hypothetical protein